MKLKTFENFNSGPTKTEISRAKANFEKWVLSQNFYHVSVLKNLKKIESKGLVSKVNFLYNELGNDIEVITDDGDGIVVFSIDKKFLEKISLYPDPEQCDNEVIETAEYANELSKEELDELYYYWEKCNGKRECKWYFSLAKIPPDKLKIKSIDT